MRRVFVFLGLFLWFSLFAGEVEIIEKKIDIHILEDGKVIKRVYEKIKINGFTGMRRAGEWFYTYNPELTEVKIIKSITHNSEGEVIHSPANAILDFSPYSVQNAPDFSGIREKIVSHTGLEPHCLIEFEYEIRDKLPHRLVVFEDLRDMFPVKEVSVTIVNNRHSKIYMSNVSLTKKGVFVAKDLDPVSVNYSGNGYYRHTPYIAILVENPTEYFKGYLKNLPVKDVKRVLKLMNAEELSGKRLLFAVLDFIDKRLNTVHLNPDVCGFKCRDFLEIVNSGYATQYEKSVLAYWIFNNLGLKPDFIFAGILKDNSPVIISDYGVQVKGIIWPFEREYVPYYNLHMKKVVTPVLKASLTVNAKEDDNGFTGKYYFEGNNGIKFKVSGLKKVSPKVLEKVNGFLVEEGKVNGKIDKKIVFYNWMENLLFLTPEDLVSLRFVEIPCPVDISESYTFVFKKPVKALFHSKNIRNSAGLCKVEYSVKGNVLKVKRHIKLSPYFYSGDSIKELKKLIVPMVSESYSTIIFE